MAVKSTAISVPKAMDERVMSVRRRLRHRFRHAMDAMPVAKHSLPNIA